MFQQALDLLMNLTKKHKPGDKQFLGKDIGGAAGGLIGSLFGPIGSMAGGAIGGEVGGDIEGVASGGDPFQYLARLMTGGFLSPIPQDPMNKKKKTVLSGTPGVIDFGQG